MNTNPILVEVSRGGIAESFHRGALAVVDADGALVQALGDIDRPVFPRSAVKVLQALPLVESGAAERFGLGDAELALACASHNGQPGHVAIASRMLARIGLDESALECGAHWPYDPSSAHALAAAGERPSALHNNCSGKHAGFLCLGCTTSGRDDPRGWLAGYVRPDHPLMQQVSAVLQAVTAWDLSRSPVGVDGCSIPTHAIPLRHLALAFARVGTGVGLSAGHASAARRLRQAVARAPEAVAGTGSFDTRVMREMGERVFCKVGAEGVYCAALPEKGLGVAIKMDDGNNSRAAEVVMAAVIEAWLAPSGSEAVLLRSLADAPLVNWRGIETGRLRASVRFTPRADPP